MNPHAHNISIDIKKEQSSWWLLPIAIASLAAHVGMYTATSHIPKKPTERYGSSRVAFETRTIPKAPEKVETEKDALIPETQEQEDAPKLVKRTRPKPNSKSEPKEPPKVQPRQQEAPPIPVFGVTAGSVLEGSSSVAVRVGNTLEKEMDLKAVSRKKVKALKQPTHDGPIAAKKPKKKRTVPIYELSSIPSFKRKVAPDYPEDAKRAGIEGTVQLEVLLDENGNVDKVRVLKTPGHNLEKAAIEALSRSKFTPGKINGKGVPVKINVPYHFVLDS